MSGTYVVLGEVLKIVREYAVVRASILPSLMEHVYDLKGSHVGHVSDVFGPVEGFYVVVRIDPGAPRLAPGEKLFVKVKKEQVKS